MDENKQLQKARQYGIVIIGGGISGLYCALKLQSHSDALPSSHKDILVLEKSSRWGGRLDTDIIDVPSTEGGAAKRVKEEEGAMRFTYNDAPEKSNMPLLARLIQDVDMAGQVERFYIQPQKDSILSNRGDGVHGTHNKLPPNCNSRYFRGKHFTDWYATQNPTMWSNMFDLRRVEEFKSSGEIVKDIYAKLLEHNKSKLRYHFPDKADVILAQNPQDERLQRYEDTNYWNFFRNEFTWRVGMEETPLNMFSMQALLTIMGYSHGCIMMMVQTQGFLCVSLSKGNVGVILQELITFNLIWDRLYQFKDGWTALVETVRSKIEKTSGTKGVTVTLRNQCGVDQISYNDTNKMFTLTLSTEEVIKARSVVMAIPPKAMQEILAQSSRLQLRDELSRLCESTVGIRCTKINLYFEDDWWNTNDGVTMFGPNITSLPCGFVYPFYGECKKTGCYGCSRCDDDPCPAALTIYCDINNAQFWSSLQSLGHKFRSPLQITYPKLTPASEYLVEEAVKQLGMVFNAPEVPTPILTSYRSWDGAVAGPGCEEYGYAIHMWPVGVDDREVMDKVVKPDKSKALYMCNEAWSAHQGWVEGSLLSTENVLSQLLADLQQGNGQMHE